MHEENNAESGSEIHVNYNVVHAEATEQAVNNENSDLVEPQIHDETSMISNTSFLMPLHKITDEIVKTNSTHQLILTSAIETVTDVRNIMPRFNDLIDMNLQKKLIFSNIC
jgi:PHP family Zn ribbon phosphoesterase